MEGGFDEFDGHLHHHRHAQAARADARQQQPDDPDGDADDGDNKGEEGEGEAQKPPQRPAVAVAIALAAHLLLPPLSPPLTNTDLLVFFLFVYDVLFTQIAIGLGLFSDGGERENRHDFQASQVKNAERQRGKRREWEVSGVL